MAITDSALHTQLLGDLDSTQGNAALCVLSLDNLGRIAGEFGIRASEFASQEFDNRISGMMRDSDRKLVLAPDRVCVVFDELRDPNHTLLVALKIERSFEQPAVFDDAPIKLTPRAGLVYCGTALERKGRDVNELYQHAETARELAIEQNTCFQIATDAEVTKARSDWNINDAIEDAVLHHHLELFYQPQVDLADETITGFEALLRWRRGDELWSPDRFLPLLSAPRMRQVTDYCLRAAIKAIAGLEATVPIAINLDPTVLRDPSFFELLIQEAEIWQVDPATLSFEITESGLVTDYERTTALLDRFRSSGYRIAIDDFGTGYSSLQHFATLPVDEIKIDRCFVTHLCEDEANQHITQTIIDLAHRFDKTVIAEGIEDQAAADILRDQGCDVAQGFHFGRPVDLATTQTLLNDGTYKRRS
jgi:EAL domain-containing protein (putative c-di-GMP-specific phosphodiesterase class I)/GGDEF domain-containing protein